LQLLLLHVNYCIIFGTVCKHLADDILVKIRTWRPKEWEPYTAPRQIRYQCHLYMYLIVQRA